jgi:hypothetical protein
MLDFPFKVKYYILPALTFKLYPNPIGAHGSAVSQGTALQAGISQV